MADYYNDSESTRMEAPESDVAEDRKEEESDSTQETFLVPKSALGGKDPEAGDICKFKAVHSYEDEIEFEYVKHDKSEKSSRDRFSERADEVASGGMMEPDAV